MGKPTTIVIDGLIGAGKSTFIRECLVPQLTSRGFRVMEIPEPVEKWKQNGRLEMFYSDIRRRAFQFQIIAFHDRVKLAQDIYNRYRDEIDIFIMERSIFTDMIFMKMLHNNKMVDDFEMQDYQNLWTMWTKVMPFVPDLFVYLKPSVNECMNRLKLRNRAEEKDVSNEYQKSLEKMHDDFFCSKNIVLDATTTRPCIVFETDKNFITDQDLQVQMTSQILQTL